MTWFGVGIGLSSSIAAILIMGAKWGLGFLAGAALSVSSMEWWKAIARGIDASGARPVAASAALLMLKLPILAAAVYVIVNVSGIASGAVIGGLLAGLAGVILGVLYEAIFPKR